jgi:methylated-DNA-[protein]-cysteine S-methyltransferase
MLAAVRIAYHMMSSPVGLLFLARTDRGLRYLQFMERKSLKRMIAARSDVAPDATWEPSLLDLKDVVEQLDAYFNGMLQEFDVPLDAIGSDFQKKVWNALRQIPFGETRSYGQIAKTIRQPKASRAVGLANNQNPIAIIVPCHRVIGANGSMTGYGGGLPRKRWLLEHESRFAGQKPTLQEMFVGAAPKARR